MNFKNKQEDCNLSNGHSNGHLNGHHMNDHRNGSFSSVEEEVQESACWVENKSVGIFNRNPLKTILIVLI